MLLALDTSGPMCSAALMDTQTGDFIFARSDDLGRGHAEHLMNMLEEELSAQGIDWKVVTRLAVVNGPGSFTGLRVGLATARGVAMALKVPCQGVTAFDAFHHEYGQGQPFACVLDAKRSQIWLQCFAADGRGDQPRAIAAETLFDELSADTKLLAGSGALLPQTAELEGFTILSTAPSAPIRAVAQFANNRSINSDKPKPLYLREPDAKPQSASKGAT